MGNKTSNSISRINYENIPTAEAVFADIPIATAYYADVKPPMPLNIVAQEGRMRNSGLRIGEMERDAVMRQQFTPEPSAPPMPIEDSYERGLRAGIDRCYVSLVREFLKSGKLDNLELLTRELDYLNERMAARKCNKRRAQIKELIEERIQLVLRHV